MINWNVSSWQIYRPYKNTPVATHYALLSSSHNDLLNLPLVKLNFLHEQTQNTWKPYLHGTRLHLLKFFNTPTTILTSCTLEANKYMSILNVLVSVPHKEFPHHGVFWIHNIYSTLYCAQYIFWVHLHNINSTPCSVPLHLFPKSHLPYQRSSSTLEYRSKLIETNQSLLDDIHSDFINAFRLTNMEKLFSFPATNTWLHRISSTCSMYNNGLRLPSKVPLSINYCANLVLMKYTLPCYDARVVLLSCGINISWNPQHSNLFFRKINSRSSTERTPITKTPLQQSFWRL